MTDPAADDTFLMPLFGREIRCKYMGGGQSVMARRLLSKAREGKGKLSEEEASRIMMQLLNCIESLIPGDDDLDYAQSLLLTGKAEVVDLIPILFGPPPTEPEPPADDEQPRAAKRAAAKAKPQKLPRKKAAAATVTANSRRVQR